MKQKKAGRTSQRQREKRRYPFNESTKLIELVDKKHYGDVVKLIERLKPYLTDGEKGAFSLTGLFFDLEAVSGQRRQDGHHHREVNHVLVKLYTCHTTQQRYEIMLT